MQRPVQQCSVIFPAGTLRPLAVVWLIGCICSDKQQMCSKWDSCLSLLISVDLSNSSTQMRLHFALLFPCEQFNSIEKVNCDFPVKNSCFNSNKLKYCMYPQFYWCRVLSAPRHQTKLNKHSFNLLNFCLYLVIKGLRQVCFMWPLCTRSTAELDLLFDKGAWACQGPYRCPSPLTSLSTLIGPQEYCFGGKGTLLLPTWTAVSSCFTESSISLRVTY